MAPAAQSGNSGVRATGSVADLRRFVFALFFIFGGITSLNHVLIPKLKHLFTLSYAEVMNLRKAAERTIRGLWNAIGRILDL